MRVWEKKNILKPIINILDKKLIIKIIWLILDYTGCCLNIIRINNIYFLIKYYKDI